MSSVLDSGTGNPQEQSLTTGICCYADIHTTRKRDVPVAGVLIIGVKISCKIEEQRSKHFTLAKTEKPLKLEKVRTIERLEQLNVLVIYLLL